MRICLSRSRLCAGRRASRSAATHDRSRRHTRHRHVSIMKQRRGTSHVAAYETGRAWETAVPRSVVDGKLAIALDGRPKYEHHKAEAERPWWNLWVWNLELDIHISKSYCHRLLRASGRHSGCPSRRCRVVRRPSAGRTPCPRRPRLRRQEAVEFDGGRLAGTQAQTRMRTPRLVLRDPLHAGRLPCPFARWAGICRSLIFPRGDALKRVPRTIRESGELSIIESRLTLHASVERIEESGARRPCGRGRLTPRRASRPRFARSRDPA
jgi:hypothetical protein